MSKLATSKTTLKTKTVKKTAPVVEVAPVVESPVVESPVAETPVAETPVEVEAPVEAEVDTMKQRFERLIKGKQDLMNELKREVQELRKMQKDHEVAVKDALKRSKRKKAPRDDANPRKPSGFASPVTVSDELYGFLEQFGVKHGDPVARTDVTRYITSYIKQHDLQNPEHRREIVPDAALATLFGEPIEHRDPEDESSPRVFSYLRLQKYLSRHFPKKAVPVVSESA